MVLSLVSSDLYASLDADYQLLDIYEAWTYDSHSQWIPPNSSLPRHPRNRNKNGLFTSYVQSCAKQKLEASGWPENILNAQNQEERAQLEEAYLDSVKAHDGVHLDRSKLEQPNPGARACAKLSLVKLFLKNTAKIEKFRMPFLAKSEKTLQPGRKLSLLAKILTAIMRFWLIPGSN